MPYRKHWTSFASLTARQVGRMKIFVVLQERGRGSRAGARNFETIARQRPALATVDGDTKFLDVGPGRDGLQSSAPKYGLACRLWE